MTDKESPRDPAPSADKAQDSKRKTIPARDVGVSLTISKKALKEVDRIQEEDDQGCPGSSEVLLAVKKAIGRVSISTSRNFDAGYAHHVHRRVTRHR